MYQTYVPMYVFTVQTNLNSIFFNEIIYGTVKGTLPVQYC